MNKLNKFEIAIASFTVLVLSTDFSKTSLTDDEINHIHDRLEDDTTFGDLREDDSEPLTFWTIMPFSEETFERGLVESEPLSDVELTNNKDVFERNEIIGNELGIEFYLAVLITLNERGQS